MLLAFSHLKEHYLTIRLITTLDEVDLVRFTELSQLLCSKVEAIRIKKTTMQHC